MQEPKIYLGCYFCRVSQLTLKETNPGLVNSILSPRYDVNEIFTHFRTPYIFPKIDKEIPHEKESEMRRHFFGNLPSFTDQHKQCEVYSVILFERNHGCDNFYESNNEEEYSCKFFVIEGDPMLFSSLFLWRYHLEKDKLILKATDEYKKYYSCNKREFIEKSNHVYNEFALKRMSEFSALFVADTNTSLIHLKFGTIHQDYTVLYLSVNEKSENKWYSLGQYRYVSCIDDSTSIDWF